MTLTMHVLPVGTSLLAKTDDLGDLDNVLPPGTFDPLSSVRQKLFQATNGDTLALDVDSLIPKTARTALSGANHRLCAEWTSVAAHRAHSPGASHDDAFVLIATDTDDGLRAAALVATHYAPEARIHYVDDPLTDAPEFIEPGGLYVYRIPELDLAAKNPPNQTWSALGSVGHAIAATASQATRNCWNVVLHLSGGYKALIPYLLVMAEGINSVFCCPERVAADREPSLRAIALHESGIGDTDRDPILVDLPIRALQGDLFTKAVELKPYLESNPINGINWDDLLGWVIERNGDRRRLSRTGIILVGVL